ncbi:MAG: hypothetical protein KDB82_11100 [Planctomycetes bacterium]|nr:hypothetical protein [Planctomycetota bacterium]
MRYMLSLIALVLCCGSLSATTIDPYTTEQLLRQADLVAELECTRAGGIVAEYSVVRTWKGLKPGDKVRIRVTPNYWGPQFPVAYVGQHWLVTASNANPYARMMSTTSGGPTPVWWRDLKCDYRLPLFQGRWLIDPDDPEKGYSDEEKKWLGDLLKRFDRFCKGTATQQEAFLLASIVAKRLPGRYDDDEKVAAEAKAFVEEVGKLEDPVEILKKLITRAKAADKESTERYQWMIAEGGLAKCKEYLAGLKDEDVPFDRKALVSGLEEKLKPDNAEDSKPDEPEAEEPPTSEQLSAWRKTFAADDESSDEFWEAFEALIRHDPEPVINWAKDKKFERDHWSSAERPFGLGSYIAWRCGKDRKKHLTTLLEAKEDGVAISAAVWLYMEDGEAGKKALEKYADKADRGGWWAALTLARRGETGHMDNLFKLMGNDPDGGMQGMPVDVLKQRLMCLLSNSAAASGVKRPPLYAPDGGGTEGWETALRKWWKANSEKLKLSDPWLPELVEQKVD